MPRPLQSAVCDYCEEVFERRPAGNDTMRFCSLAHASAANSAKMRSPSGLPNWRICPSCGGERGKNGSSKQCLKCRRRQDAERVQAMTLGELREAYSTSQYHAKIRGHSRAAYAGEWACLVCGYSLHVDVCHLRDVKDFPMSATLGDVNDPSNLVALCKNHHWEFDNGHLSVSGLLKKRKGEAA